MSAGADPTEILTVAIPLDELLYPKEIARLDTYKDDCTRTFWLTRVISSVRSKNLSNATSSNPSSFSNAPKPKERAKKVRMPRSEYEAYWATDEKGKYIGKQPQGEGREILRERYWAELGLFGKSARMRKSDRDRTVF